MKDSVFPVTSLTLVISLGPRSGNCLYKSHLNLLHFWPEQDLKKNRMQNFLLKIHII